MSADSIKDALRMMPYGFYSITSRHGDEVNAMVANWVTQVAFEPRMVAIGLQNANRFGHGIKHVIRSFVRRQQLIDGLTHLRILTADPIQISLPLSESKQAADAEAGENVSTRSPSIATESPGRVLPSATPAFFTGLDGLVSAVHRTAPSAAETA